MIDLSNCLNNEIYMQTTMTCPKMKRKQGEKAHLAGKEKRGRGGEGRRRTRSERRARKRRDMKGKGFHSALPVPKAATLSK